jgi:hypothetical protein
MAYRVPKAKLHRSQCLQWVESCHNTRYRGASRSQFGEQEGANLGLVTASNVFVSKHVVAAKSVEAAEGKVLRLHIYP